MSANNLGKLRHGFGTAPPGARRRYLPGPRLLGKAGGSFLGNLPKHFAKSFNFNIVFGQFAQNLGGARSGALADMSLP
jgi:hypothetical protein